MAISGDFFFTFQDFSGTVGTLDVTKISAILKRQRYALSVELLSSAAQLQQPV